MRISDWSSDVCSSDLTRQSTSAASVAEKSTPRRTDSNFSLWARSVWATSVMPPQATAIEILSCLRMSAESLRAVADALTRDIFMRCPPRVYLRRSEAQTYELQSLIHISYAVFDLEKKKSKN